MLCHFRYSANKPRGVANRNAGLKWIRENHCRGPLGNAEKPCRGVVYFGDDDNTYDLRLFEEIRHTNTVSMFPVGLVGRQGISSPLVKDGKVIGFTDPWFHHRKFPIDMAGFAFNVKLLLETKAKMPFTVGMEEDLFIKALGVKYDDIEPLADDCTKVLVWHTQTQRRKKVRSFRPSHLAGSNLRGLMDTLKDMGVLNIDEGSIDTLPVCLQEKCH